MWWTWPHSQAINGLGMMWWTQPHSQATNGLGMRLMWTDWLFTPTTCPLFIYGSCDHIRTVPSLVVTDIGMKEWKLDEGCVETTTLLHCVIWSPRKSHENTYHTHWRVHACVCVKSAGRAQILAAAVSGSQIASFPGLPSQLTRWKTW